MKLLGLEVVLNDRVAPDRVVLVYRLSCPSGCQVAMGQWQRRDIAGRAAVASGVVLLHSMPVVLRGILSMKFVVQNTESKQYMTLGHFPERKGYAAVHWNWSLNGQNARVFNSVGELVSLIRQETLDNPEPRGYVATEQPSWGLFGVQAREGFEPTGYRIA